MEIKLIEKLVDGVSVEKEIHMELIDMRFPNSTTQVQMTIGTANLLLEQLSKKLSSIPF